MENFRTSDHNLSATYMTQAEANAVMELWAVRQREEAARQSLITVHDVAEATQLSSLEVERLLQEVRNSGGTATRVSARPTKPESAQFNLQPEPSLWAAWRKVAPWTILVAFSMSLYLDRGFDLLGRHARSLGTGLLFYAMGMGLWQLFKLAAPRIIQAFRGRISASEIRS